MERAPQIPGATARPTAARLLLAVINLLAAEIPGCRWLDLCCGSGAMACEALQRGTAEVVAVDEGSPHRRGGAGQSGGGGRRAVCAGEGKGGECGGAALAGPQPPAPR